MHARGVHMFARLPELQADHARPTPAVLDRQRPYGIGVGSGRFHSPLIRVSLGPYIRKTMKKEPDSVGNQLAFFAPPGASCCR